MSNVVGCIIEQHASQFKGGAARAKASMSATPRRGFRFEHGGTIAADQTRAMRVLRSVRFTLQSPALRASQPVDDGQAPAGDDEVFAEQAAQFGLTPVQLAIAIEAWSAAVEDPYGRGLAALNRQRYADARRLIANSLVTGTNDVSVLKRYVPLAGAEYELGRSSAAEAAATHCTHRQS